MAVFIQKDIGRLGRNPEAPVALPGERPGGAAAQGRGQMQRKSHQTAESGAQPSSEPFAETSRGEGRGGQADGRKVSVKPQNLADFATDQRWPERASPQPTGPVAPFAETVTATASDTILPLPSHFPFGRPRMSPLWGHDASHRGRPGKAPAVLPWSLRTPWQGLPSGLGRPRSGCACVPAQG